MKKKIIVLVGCIFATLFMAGCGRTYPKVSVECSMWEDEELKIGVGNKYKFDRYEKTDTDDGCVVSIYFKNNNGE